MQSKDILSKQNFYLSFILLFVGFIFSCFALNGLGNNGDSVLHFLIAKYAPQHPHLFFFHWGKPFFTLLASGFAQFGFEGIKVFNTICTFLAIYFSYQLAQVLGIRNASLLLFLVLLWPLTMGVNFTGLTEPLFACVLAISIYLIASNKELQGSFWLSFLPFVRSEGLIVILVLALYFLIHKNTKALAMLMAGHLLMSIAGFWIYKDIAWVFTKIPYAYLNPIYGTGTWDHFFIQFNFMIGPIQYGLCWISFLILLWKYKFGIVKALLLEKKLFLIYSLFIAFFIAHTLFWTLGIFGSMGLTRVFYGIMPILAIVVLEGYNAIETGLSTYHKNIKIGILSILLVLIFVFPFLNNPASFSLKRDLYMCPQEVLLKDSVSVYLKTKFPNQLVVASDYRVPYFSGIDPFDSTVYQSGRSIQQVIANKQAFVLVWDNWFSPVEDHLYLENIKPDSGYVLQKTFELKQNNNEHVFKVFTHAGS